MVSVRAGATGSTKKKPIVAMIVAITITYNSHADGILEPFLDSIRAQTGCDWHLVIIDNDSRDGTPDYLRGINDPRITVVLNSENIGFAAGCNQGHAIAEKMGADSILLINNDTEFGPDLLAGLEKRMAASGAAAVSPLIVYHDARDRIWYGGGHISPLQGFMNVHEHLNESVQVLPGEAFETGFAPGCCLLIDAATFARLGKFDPAFFVYCEDADLCVRIQRAGGKIVVDPALILYHRASTSTGGANSDFSIRQISKNQMIFVKKNYGLPGLLLAVPVTLAKTAVATAIAKISPAQAMLRIRSMGDGLTYRTTAQHTP